MSIEALVAAMGGLVAFHADAPLCLSSARHLNHAGVVFFVFARDAAFNKGHVIAARVGDVDFDGVEGCERQAEGGANEWVHGYTCPGEAGDVVVTAHGFSVAIDDGG